jgi:hypothetical protein
MFVGHSKGVVYQLVKSILPNLFVTDINATVECRKVNIDPPGIFGCLAKETAILYDFCIYGVFKGVGVTRLIENFVLLFREFNFEIPPWLRRVVTITAGNYNKAKEKGIFEDEKKPAKKKW